MINIDKRPIHIQPNKGDATAGILRIANFDKQERFKRAAKVWGFCWLFAVLSVPVIIAHWILVPGFLLAGPIMAIRRYKVLSVVEGASGACPACHVEVTIPMEADDTLPKWTYCPKCNAPVQLLSNESTP